MRGALLASAATAGASYVFGQTAEPWSALGQYGAAGIVAGILIWRYERSLQHAEARALKAEEQRDAMSDRALADLVPLVAEVARTMVPALDRFVTEFQRVSDRLDRLDRGP